MQKPRHLINVFETAFTVFVALFLALRVVAQPLVLAAPEPGLMALCSGGKIVYVSIETGQPVETDGEHGLAADPCPFFGVTAFDATDHPGLPQTSQVLRSLEKSLTGQPALTPRHVRQNAARAPPVHS